MSAQHTPGPWGFGRSTGGGIIFAPDGIRPICEVISSQDRRLIQAAPELLAALEDLHGQVRRFCETEGEADFETGRAVAAIAKVKGGAA